MGINIILPLIMGIAMTVIIGSQVAPSFVEQMKVAKVENRTISNQNLIKDAIVRYIKMEKKVPKDLGELKTYGILKDYHESNLFGGGYEFFIDNKKGILKIRTTINDDVAGKYFSNSFKFPNTPKCVKLNGDGTCENNLWETFYLLDEDTFKSIPIPIPEVGSKEDVLDRFTEDNIGKKKDKDGKEIVFNVGDKDNFLKDNNNGTFTITEKVKKSDGTWSNTGKETIISGNNIGKETGVSVNNNLVDCDKATTPPASGQEVFVVNKDTSLGEIIWVAPNNVSDIKNKIFGSGHTSTSPVVYTPNNICTSNVTNMYEMFKNKNTFNEPLNRWDTSKVTTMEGMFRNAIKFNSLLKFDTSNVTNMKSMFSMFAGPSSFNQPLNFNTSNVIDMSFMFRNAYNFNQPLNFNTSNVIDMSYMFLNAYNFNQPLNFNTSNVTSMEWMFFTAQSFNEQLNFDTSKVTSMYSMFNSAHKFNQKLNFNTSNVTNMESMFSYANSFNNGCLENYFSCPLEFDTSKVTTMEDMFYNTKYFNQELKFDTSNVTNMDYMFYQASYFYQDLSGWCVNKIDSSPSKPNNFDTESGFAYNNYMQPQWGDCP